MSNNTTFTALTKILTIPRTNGSPELAATRQRLVDWANKHGITTRLHTYRLYPYFLEIGGAWLIASQLLLALTVWMRWGWLTLPIAVIGVAIPLAEIRGIAILSSLISKKAENIIIEVEPKEKIEQEIILTAHYDSKTEPFSERYRRFFVIKAPAAFLLSLIIGIIALVTKLSGWSVSYWLGVALTIPQLLLFLPLGINYMLGEFAPPSEGATDNGAACTLLLTLAEQLTLKKIQATRSKITIVLFSGEEVIVQGSRAYVADRTFPHPTYAINLELLGQNGAFHIWQKIGSPFEAYQTDQALNDLLNALVKQATNEPIDFSNGPAGTDTLAFLKAGVAATCLSSLDKELGISGIHTPADNASRIDFTKLSLTLDIVNNLINQLDNIIHQNLTVLEG